MPAKVKVRILAGRNLPVMDKSSDASDAFVEVKLGNTTYKTEVYRRSLNPFWNSEWFRFEVSDQELQDEPLQIRIMDYDTYSANDAIGKVYINLNPLLVNRSHMMSGWLPIYDTLHGIRGEINCMVKVNLFADNNRYRNSSCGIRFFFSDIPNGYKCEAILGFVDELLVNDDPEYQWIDKIRTPRASNEARQTLFVKLSGEVQRKLGLKAEIFGGNAVIGYQQSFDLEGGSGIVGRGIGTAVVLRKIGSPHDGIISPLGGSPQSNHPPHASQKNSSKPSKYYDRDSSIYKKRSHHVRQLVHSISADHFYETPVNAFNKKLSDVLENNKVLRHIKRTSKIQFSTNYDSDSSFYEDCEETLSNSSTTVTNSNDFLPHNLLIKSKQVDDAIDSPRNNLRSTKLSSQLRNSNSTDDDITRLSFDGNLPARGKRKSTAGILLTKLRRTNRAFTNTLATATKNNILSKQGLTKLISFRKVKSQQKQFRSTSSELANVTSPQTSTFQESKGPTTTVQKSLTKSISDSSQAPITISQHNSTSSTNSTSQSGNTSGAYSGAQRRRRDRSQSASIDDALSIIEEKYDDDDHNPMKHAECKHNQQLSDKQKDSELQPRIRLLSSSSAAKQRGMVRSKEFDMKDDHSMPGVESKSKTFSVSSIDDEDEDNPNSSATTLSSSTIDAKTPMERSESVLSSSTPSTSMLTEETIKGAKLNSELPTGNRLTSPKNTYAIMRRSDTDITASVQSQTMKTSASMEKSEDKKAQSPSNADSMNRSKSSYTHSESITRNDVKQSNSSSSAQNNFIQTVKTIKVEQKLLHNLIKQQNSNLNATNKTRNMFTYPNRVHQSEYPFVTLKKFPEKMIDCTGGVVSVHSVKLLDHIINDEESETRDIWWTEIRREIRSHAKALNCNTILGYSETSKVIGDVCILSACGTAAILRDPVAEIEAHDQKTDKRNFAQQGPTSKTRRSGTPPPSVQSPTLPTLTSLNNQSESFVDQTSGSSPSHRETQKDDPSQEQPHKNADGVDSGSDELKDIDCSFCHTSLTCLDFSTSSICGVCKSSKVPDVLLLTIEPPENLNIATTGTIIQARVCRIKRDSHGEASAKEIGDALPFLEYELHRQLFSKLKFKGFNCIFNLTFDVSVGENMLTALATGTGCYVVGLPTPEPPRISAGKGIKASRLAEIQRLISTSAIKNREKLGLEQIHARLESYHKKLETTATLDGEDSELNAVSDSMNQEPSSKLSVPSTSFAPDSGSDIYASGDNSGARASGSKRTSHRYHGHQHKYQSDHQARKRKTSQVHREDENLVSLVSDENNIVLEVDDNEDANIIALLIDSEIPEGYLVCNSETVPTITQDSITSINMFTQVMRCKLVDVDKFAQQFDWIMQSLFVKLRRSLPCCLTHLNFIVDLPESDLVQISVTGCLLSLNTIPGKTDATGLHEQGANTAASSNANIQDLNNQQVPCEGTTSSLTSTSSITSSSSSSSSASPTSSTVSTLRSSSSSSSSARSVKACAPKNPSPQTSAVTACPSSSSIQTKAGEQVKSITKKLSNTNIAALLTGGSVKNKQQGGKEIELMDRRQQQTQVDETTSATIAAVKQEIEQNRLGQKVTRTSSGHMFKPVFKKQQTYPGANSPAISGQDRLIPPAINTTAANLNEQASNATKKATFILKKVKQPLKDLGSNFNNGNGGLSGSNGASDGAFNSNSKFSSSRQAGTSKSRSANTMIESPSKLKSQGSPVAGTSSQLSCSSPVSNSGLGSAHSQIIGDPDIRSSSSINSSIDITSLSYIPGTKEYHYLGNLSFSFVRETSSVRENGGLNGFIHCFLMEVYAIVRAHVSALGGNAFLSFRLQQSCIFYHSNKNQAQCLISVAGDAVQVVI